MAGGGNAKPSKTSRTEMLHATESYKSAIKLHIWLLDSRFCLQSRKKDFQPQQCGTSRKLPSLELLLGLETRPTVRTNFGCMWRLDDMWSKVVYCSSYSQGFNLAW